MPTPNPAPDPDDYDDDRDVLPGRSAAEKAHDDDVIAALSADMAGTSAAALAAQLVPVIQDGGALGQTVTPHLQRVSRARETAGIWGPAIAATGAAGVAVAVLPLPGPLALYILALAAFAWWHCAGRPGPSEAARMLAYSAADAGAWIRRQIEHLARWRARYETRRTNPEKKEN
ncbi:hypothetical protein [Nocardia harenae]|uniref:hypothetical protein n=1 Tax=Nocardia harenae TaxID=358707 RepID=UPI000836CDE0|nr:hypothetical protein [Nocardia harenae]